MANLVNNDSRYLALNGLKNCPIYKFDHSRPIFFRKSFYKNAPVVDVIKLFLGNLDFTKIKKFKKLYSDVGMNLHKNMKKSIFNQKCSLKLFIAF